MTEFALEQLDSGSLEELQQRGSESTEANPLELVLNLQEPPEPAASAVFAGALMTGLKEIPLRISHDADEVLLNNIFRSGLAAALGSRGGLTTFADPHSPLNAPELSATWTPGTAAFRAAMFRDEEGESTGLFGPSHAIFLNAHRTTTPPGPSSITRLVRRWLGHRLDDSESAATCLHNVGFALDQLVVNITEHAVTEQTPSVTSLVRVELEGDDAAPPRALVLVVVDTGAGIATTLRAKLDDASADSELLTELLEGNLSRWGRGRGVGLSRLTQLVQQARGSMFVAVRGTSVAVAGEAFTVDAAPATISGSVISLRLPLQS
jgi:anti-sigma regulatory factor (Ser/Thr protein kinase)